MWCVCSLTLIHLRFTLFSFVHSQYQWNITLSICLLHANFEYTKTSYEKKTSFIKDKFIVFIQKTKEIRTAWAHFLFCCSSCNFCFVFFFGRFLGIFSALSSLQWKYTAKFNLPLQLDVSFKPFYYIFNVAISWIDFFSKDGKYSTLNT